MTPWFTMPSDREARRQAAADELVGAVAGIAQALDVLAQGPVSPRERRLLRAIGAELARVRRATRILSDACCP